MNERIQFRSGGERYDGVDLFGKLRSFEGWNVLKKGISEHPLLAHVIGSVTLSALVFYLLV